MNISWKRAALGRRGAVDIGARSSASAAFARVFCGGWAHIKFTESSGWSVHSHWDEAVTAQWSNDSAVAIPSCSRRLGVGGALCLAVFAVFGGNAWRRSTPLLEGEPGTVGSIVVRPKGSGLLLLSHWCACDCQLAVCQRNICQLPTLFALARPSAHAAHKLSNKVIGKNRRLAPPHIRHLGQPSFDAFGRSTVATYSRATTDYTHTSWMHAYTKIKKNMYNR